MVSDLLILKIVAVQASSLGWWLGEERHFDIAQRRSHLEEQLADERERAKCRVWMDC